MLKPVRRQVLYAGLSVPIVFWGTLALCGHRLEGYSPMSRLVSELGAAGTPTRALFAAGLLLCAALSLAFVVGLVGECRRARISTAPVLVILTFTASIAGAAIFPMPHRLHEILGSPSVLMPLSPLLAGLLWRRTSFPPGVRLFSALGFLAMSLGFLAFFPAVLAGYPGLKQRLFHMGWSLWFVYLGVAFSGIHGRRGEQRSRPTSGSAGSGSH